MHRAALPVISLLALLASCGARSPLYELATSAPDTDAGADAPTSSPEAANDSPLEAAFDVQVEAPPSDAPWEASWDAAIDVFPDVPVPGLSKLWIGGSSASHSCAIRMDASLYCWGNNHDGQLGDGSSDDAAVPELITTSPKKGLVSLGGAHTLAVGVGLMGWAWGDNSLGQLGNNSTTDSNTQSPIGFLFRFLVAGGHHGCGVRDALGDLVCWGSNDAGQLALSPVGGMQPAPLTVSLPVAIDLNAPIPLAAGLRHSCAIADKRLWCWGDNKYGQLGLGNKDTQTSPAPVELPGTPWQVAAGMRHTCALLVDGQVWCWGEGGYGQLGNGSFDGSSSPMPVQIPASKIIQIAAGGAHNCLLTSAGNVHCWGLNGSGQLGNGSLESSAAPIPIGLADASDVAAGSEHTCAARNNGTIVCWGSNQQGQLGIGTIGGMETKPMAVTGLP